MVPPDSGGTGYEITFTIETGPPLPIPSSTELAEPVNFAPSATSALRSGRLPSGPALKQYALAGKSGQTLTVELLSDDAPLSVTFTTPSGMSGYRSEHKFVLDESGVYIVTIAKSGKTPSTDYTVVFTIE